MSTGYAEPQLSPLSSGNMGTEFHVPGPGSGGLRDQRAQRAPHLLFPGPVLSSLGGHKEAEYKELLGPLLPSTCFLALETERSDVQLGPLWERE